MYVVYPWLNCYKQYTLCIIMTLEKCTVMYHVWPYRHTVMCPTCDHTDTQLHVPRVSIQGHSYMCPTCDHTGTQLHVPRVTVQVHSCVTHVWPYRHTVACAMCDYTGTQLHADVFPHIQNLATLYKHWLQYEIIGKIRTESVETISILTLSCFYIFVVHSA